MENNAINKILDDLENNAIFKLSLSSNELFHSNFWHWLLTKYYDTIPDIVKVFYSDFKDNLCKETIKRENRHTDLSFICNDKLIIIENKIKSYPSIEQLERYAKNNKNLDRIILISYFKPIFLNKLKKESNEIYKYDNGNFSFRIEYLSYQILQKQLEIFVEKIKETSEDEIENKYIIKNYIKCLRLLNELFKNITHENNTYDLYDNDFGAFNDIYIKYRTAELTEYISKSLKNEFDIDVGFGFNNKKGTIDIIINDSSPDAKNYDFRIQMEGEQFRLCIRHDIKNQKELTNISKVLLDKKLWFSNTKTYGKEFCYYGDHFIYRYKKINEIFEKNLRDVSYNELSEYTKEVLKKFLKNISSIKACIK